MKPIKHWPFVETPGEFTERLQTAIYRSIDLLAAVRTVLIEEPPMISEKYIVLRRASDPGRHPDPITDAAERAVLGLD